jgi:hypothetical protein
MSDTARSGIHAGKASIGDEIPYRRDRIDKKTGSLVFDRHLNEKLTDVPEQRVQSMRRDANQQAR